MGGVGGCSEMIQKKKNFLKKLVEKLLLDGEELREN